MQDSNLEVSRHLFGSRLNVHSQANWAIEGQAKNLNSTARPYDEWAFSPLDFTAVWLSHLALVIYMFVVVNFDALAQARDILIWRKQYHTRTKYFSNIPGLYEEIGTWSYRYSVLYVKLRCAKNRLKYNMQMLAFLQPSLYIGAIPIMLMIAKVVPRGLCPWGNVWAVYIRFGLNNNNYFATPLAYNSMPNNQ